MTLIPCLQGDLLASDEFLWLLAVSPAAGASAPPLAPITVAGALAPPLTPPPPVDPLPPKISSYSHADWAQKQRAEPLCHAAIRFLILNCPSPFPDGLCDHLPSHARPSPSDVEELASKGRLFTDDDGVTLLVRKLTPPRPPHPDRPGGRAARLLNDEPTRIYVPLLTRPWIMHACHADASCHLGVTRTLQMLERFFWWVGMEVCTRWWVPHCLKCQARTTMSQFFLWPILSLPLPNGPGISVSVDYFGPLAVTPRGNSYILLFTDRFSRRADMYAVTGAEFTAEGTADVLVNQYIPK